MVKTLANGAKFEVGFQAGLLPLLSYYVVLYPMTTAIIKKSFKERTEWLALFTLIACSFVIPISVTATTITFLLAWVLILISGQWRERWQRIKNNPAALSYWVLFALFVIGLIYTVSPGHLAFKDLQKRHWLLIAPFFMMIIKDDHWRERIVNAFLIAMIFTLVLSYLKWAGFDFYLMLFHKTLPGVGVFFEHIVQSFFLCIAAFIFGYRFFYRTRWRWIYLTLFILIAINILFLSHGRTGYLQILLLLAFLSFIRFSWKGVLGAFLLSMILLGTAFSIPGSFRTRILNIGKQYQNYHQGKTKTAIGQRIGMWEDAMILIKKHPWTGYGTGGIHTAMQENLSIKQINKTGPIDYVEYSYLNFLLQFGVFGLIIFLGVVATQIVISFRLPREYKYMMQAFLIAYLTGSLFNSFFVSYCEVHLYAIFSALCFSTLKPTRIKEVVSPGNYEKIRP